MTLLKVGQVTSNVLGIKLGHGLNESPGMGCFGCWGRWGWGLEFY